MKDLLRRFPGRADDCILAVSSVPAGGVSEPAGRAAYVFILGEYGHILPEAPYALEAMLEEFSEEESPLVSGFCCVHPPLVSPAPGELRVSRNMLQGEG